MYPSYILVTPVLTDAHIVHRKSATLFESSMPVHGQMRDMLTSTQRIEDRVSLERQLTPHALQVIPSVSQYQYRYNQDT